MPRLSCGRPVGARNLPWCSASAQALRGGPAARCGTDKAPARGAASQPPFLAPRHLARFLAPHNLPCPPTVPSASGMPAGVHLTHTPAPPVLNKMVGTEPVAANGGSVAAAAAADHGSKGFKLVGASNFKVNTMWGCIVRGGMGGRWMLFKGGGTCTLSRQQEASSLADLPCSEPHPSVAAYATQQRSEPHAAAQLLVRLPAGCAASSCLHAL